jgi:hypothetical protein
MQELRWLYARRNAAEARPLSITSTSPSTPSQKHSFLLTKPLSIFPFLLNLNPDTTLGPDSRLPPAARVTSDHKKDCCPRGFAVRLLRLCSK